MRIELGEIQEAINSYPGIQQSVVIAKNLIKNNLSTSKKCLIGYYISDEKILEIQIKQFLQTKIPQYMIPNRIVRIDEVPTNINGKLDLKKLPEVEFFDQIEEYEAPKSEVQVILCNIWSEIFDIPAEKIGINDDFYNLGGDSIMALKLKFAISEAFSVDMTPNHFQYKITIKTMSEYVETNKNQLKKIKITHFNTSKEILSFAQERLLVIDQLENTANVYNIPIYLKFSNGTNIDLFRKALLSVIRYQDILRTIFINENGIILQKTIGKLEFVVHP